MAKQAKSIAEASALDDIIIELLAEAQEPVEIPAERVASMRANVLDRVTCDQSCEENGFQTHRKKEGGWIKEIPGAEIKILHEEADGLLSYFVRLEPGFEMEGHDHPFDEEFLMLEGDVTFGDLTLYAGDYHFAPKGMPHGRVSSEHGCLAYIRGALPV